MSSNTSGLARKAYEILLDRIVTMEYLPGSIINEAGLVDDLGISRTPIHSACIKLSQEKLVEFLPKKGMRVSTLNADTIRDIHDIRDLIEPYAIRNFGSLMSKSTILEYLRIFRDPNTSRRALYEADTRMHMEIVAQTKNKLLCDYFASLQNQFKRISNACGQMRQSRIYDSNHEHEAMLVALLNDDLEAAEAAIRIHLRKSREVAYEVLVINSNQLNTFSTESETKE